jgi:hypothetical protein
VLEASRSLTSDLVVSKQPLSNPILEPPAATSLCPLLSPYQPPQIYHPTTTYSLLPLTHHRHPQPPGLPRSTTSLSHLLLPHAEMAELIRYASRQGRAATGVTHPVVLPVSSLRTSSSTVRKVKDEVEEPGKAIIAMVVVS